MNFFAVFKSNSPTTHCISISMERMKKEGMETMMHVRHKHALILREKERTHETFCDVCRRIIVGSAYDCEQRKCDFSIHRSCAKFPQQIQHPFHPQHPLTFLASPPPDDDSKKSDCSACGMIGWEFIYHCSDCQFSLDVACAALTPTKDHQDQSNNQLQLQILSHPHPLIICDHNDKYSPVICSACRLPMEDLHLICVCLECKCLLHQSCTYFPEEIKHPFHPEHPLSLLHRAPYESGRFGCNACRRGSAGFTYNCSQCQFDLDVHCASLMPITQDQEHQPHQRLRHPHPLLLCSKKANFPYRCIACKLPFKDSIYVCLLCRNLLHKSCSELPEKIEHPFHRLHPLTLRKTSRRISCRACRKFTTGFAYGCLSCRFQVHTRCGWPIPPSIRSEYHNHRLALLSIEADRLLCNSCKKHSNTPFFSCVECNFNLHLHCYPKLPPTIKHKSHFHPLTFTKSPIKGDPDQDHEDDHKEFYCSVCEEKRDLSDPSYYCPECHYIAHVHCVFSGVIHLLKEEWSLAWENGGTELDTPTNVVKEDTDEMVRDVSSSSLVELDHEEIEKLPTKEETEIEKLHTEVEVEEAKLEALKTEVEEQEAKVTVLKTKFKALEVKYEQR
ncbi:hypothetical protein F0562_011691 [Nyssa sinensis]|uniref:Phorbol-ester/DAG-type domain-containing protein n=1 Tax=Nyssa sinensis TaxID=561372 RepID=A0A5J4ZV69_9ASTE|nr:hypothetical protein F0562_011691 [Nyssa sinensis]